MWGTQIVCCQDDLLPESDEHLGYWVHTDTTMNIDDIHRDGYDLSASQDVDREVAKDLAGAGARIQMLLCMGVA